MNPAQTQTTDTPLIGDKPKMLTQAQHYELARRQIAACNAAFMDLVNCKTNPLTREDLAANITRRPALWSRFAGYLNALPSRDDIQS